MNKVEQYLKATSDKYETELGEIYDFYSRRFKYISMFKSIRANIAFISALKFRFPEGTIVKGTNLVIGKHKCSYLLHYRGMNFAEFGVIELGPFDEIEIDHDVYLHCISYEADVNKYSDIIAVFNHGISDCNWMDGNCFYYAYMLKQIFPLGTIVYDVIYGHFMLRYMDRYFDYTGEREYDPEWYIVEFDKLDQYDVKVEERIYRDVIF